MRGRQLKKKIGALLRADDFDRGLEEVLRLPARQAVNPLFSLLYDLEPLTRWRAVVAMGAVVSALYEHRPESARVVMRRLIWSLNDESGGIGWGSPEAMGEICARSARLAEEYGCLLGAYIRPGGLFLEHEPLQRGALWAVGRLGRVRPQLLLGSAVHLQPFLRNRDAALRGLAAWAAGALAEITAWPLLEKLVDDGGRLQLFRNGRLQTCTVGQLAAEALAAVRSGADAPA